METPCIQKTDEFLLGVEVNQVESKLGNEFGFLQMKQKTKRQIINQRKSKGTQIKDVISNQKVNVIKQYFIQKLRRNNQFALPIQHFFLEDS